MVALEEAKKKVEQVLNNTDLHIGEIMDDGQYFIFGYVEEVDISPIGVDKNTGEVANYFPPDHLQAYMNAVEVKG